MPLPDPPALLVLTTLPETADAAAFAQSLVSSRLAACVSALPPMESFYAWRGQIEQARERQLLIKTTPARLEALLARLGDLHPYEVPETLVVPVTGGGADYLAWLASSTAP